MWQWSLKVREGAHVWPEVLEGTGVPMCGQWSLKVQEGAHVWPEVLEGTGVPMCG